jgi:hypothetical protein
VSIVTVDINMFWHGPELGVVHRACIRSFRRHGHHVRLHCYTPPRDAPDDCELFDASRIMPLADLLRDAKTGSVAIGVDRYRYRIIAAGMGVYSDCDMFCLRPIPAEHYMFGFEDGKYINNAFLSYPPGSALAEYLLRWTRDEYAIPEWLTARRKLFMRGLKALGRPMPATRLRWGVWGPHLLTNGVRKSGMMAAAKPVETFYPLHYTAVDKLYDPSLRLSDVAGPGSAAIHLWHKASDKRPVPKSGPLSEIVGSLGMAA